MRLRARLNSAFIARASKPFTVAMDPFVTNSIASGVISLCEAQSDSHEHLTLLADRMFSPDLSPDLAGLGRHMREVQAIAAACWQRTSSTPDAAASAPMACARERNLCHCCRECSSARRCSGLPANSFGQY